jgi:hypothetical protein
VLIAAPYDLPEDVFVNGEVPEEGTVSIRVCDMSASGFDPPGAFYRVLIFRLDA